MAGRNTGGSGSTSPNKTKPSETKTSTKGTDIKLETGMNKTYLCAHICAASKAPNLGKTGNRLFQRTVEEGIKKKLMLILEFGLI